MWWWAVVTVLFWNTITSQPIKEESGNDAPRLPRQLDFVHCCPCPSPDLPDLSHPGFDAANVGANGVSRAAPVDDCPCRSRGSDTQGESSVFFPRAVPFRPFVKRPEVQKEDQKPLLHPEVDLASSMLETLREVTDEEYQDALARDAARNAARFSELGDAEPETAKNLVTIIVNPRDITEDDTEVTPESSNVQETRCLHPLAMPHSGQDRSSNIFKLQSTSISKDSSDLDDGASEVKENVFDLRKGLVGLKLKSTPPLLKLLPPRKINDGNIQRLLKVKNDKQPKLNEDNSSFLKGSNLGSKIPNLNLTHLFKKPEPTSQKPLQLKPLEIDLKSLKLPTLRTNLNRKPKISVTGNTDSGTSPSILQEHIFKPKKDINIPTLDLKSLLSSHDPANFSLKKLLNLKDVELVLPKSNESNKQIPGLGLLPPLTFNRPTKDIKKSCNGEKIDVERSQKFQTEILDTLPHASENHPVFATSSNNQLETTTVAVSSDSPVIENTNIKTQILDVLPSASENTNFVTDIDKEVATPTAPSTEIMENINEDQGLEEHAMEESVIESSNTLPKQNTVNISEDESSLELIIGGDEDTQIDAVEFIEESELPTDETGIGGVTFNNNGQAFDLDFVEDTSSINGEENSSIAAESNNSVLGFTSFDEEQEYEDEMNGVDTFFREKTFTDGVNEDAVFNEDFNTLSENVEEGSTPILFGSNLRSAVSLDELPNVKAPKPNSDLLSSLKERISLKLETLKNADKSKILTISRISIPDNKEEQTKSVEATDFDTFTEESDKKAELESSTSNKMTFQDISNTPDIDILTERAENFSTEDKKVVKTMQDLPNVSDSDRSSKDGGQLQTKEEEAEMDTGASNLVTIQDSSHISDANKLKNVENFDTEKKSVEIDAGDLNQETVLILSDSDSLTEDGVQFDNEEKATDIDSNKSNEVDMHNLSHISDSFLAASQTKIQESHELETEFNSSEETSDLTSASNIENKKERISHSDTEPSGTILNVEETLSLEENTSDHEHHLNHEIGENYLKEAEGRETPKVKESAMNSCLCTLTRKQDLREEPKAVKENDENEMSPQASENMFNTAAQPFGLTPFLRQSIVQPNPIFGPSSLLPPVQPLDLSNLNLPTLEDLTSGLGLLGGNARESDGDRISSTEFESTEDCSEAEVGMATGASSNKAKSAFATLKPLEDINLDIFQINPLSQGGLASKMPSLNLNSFKTKLSMPPLGLKPLKLESSLGRKNGGLLGASLTFGPEKLGSSKKAVNKLGSILNKQGSDILGNSLASMPSLEELRSTMRANTESLLGSPLLTLNPFENPLKSSQDLGESLRSHTENTMRNLQQSLASTFTEARSSGINSPILNNKFANPQELFEKVSLAHEDMNDKLHAIHIDLQDRLSSIHDRIIDQSHLPALRTPLLGLAKVEEEPSGTWRIGNKKNKPSSTRSQSSRITSKPIKVVAKKTKAKVNRPNTKDRVDVNPFKISKAASSLTPKSVEVPKLVTSSLAPPFLRPLQRDSSLKLREIGNLSNEKPKAPLKKQFKPFGDFTITIETTPRPNNKKVSLRPDNLKASTNIKAEQKPLLKTSPKPFRSKLFSDSRGFASETKPTQVPAPVRPSEETTELRSCPAVPSSKSILESRTFPSRSLAIPERIPLKTGPTKLSLPKPTESPLVTKMREAIKIRFSRPVQPKKLQHMGSLAKPLRSYDMANAASENNAVVLRPEPMKENVSYKCKMVCTRD